MGKVLRPIPSRAQVHKQIIYMYRTNFEKPLEPCSADQDQCSFNGRAGSESYRDGHVNSSIFLWKFANKEVEVFLFKRVRDGRFGVRIKKETFRYRT